MKRRRISDATLMLLTCALPLLVLFTLALAGMSLNPLWVPVILVLCCLAMFFLSAGACHHDESRPSTRTASQEALRPPAELPKTDDVFRVEHGRRLGEAIVQQGELLRAPGEAYEILKERSANTGVTPLLQEDRKGDALLVWLPGEPAQSATKTVTPWLNALLLLITLATTTWAGASHAGVDLRREPGRFREGLPYSFTLLLILGAHELGHYFAAGAHGMRVTLPFFIPVPFGLGTFGAFIRLRSPAETRRALFDVGVAGPLAGLVFAIPALAIGLQHSHVVAAEAPADHMHGGVSVGSSALLALTAKWALGSALADSHRLILHPLAFAGWLGLLVTALNLLPIGQLDGGHVADSMFGRVRGAAIGTAALFGLLFLGLFVWSGLLTWAVIVYLIAGEKGLPPLNDISRLDAGRMAIGAFTFLLLALILTPVPHRLYDSLGIHCPYL